MCILEEDEIANLENVIKGQTKGLLNWIDEKENEFN